MSEMRSTRIAFGDGLIKLAREREDVVAMAADNSRAMNMGPFMKEFPTRYFEFGIAEQNMVMAAAGMASTGKIVFVTTYGVFICMRALEQVRTFVAYPELNVKFIGALGGLSGDTEGVTHQATEDLSIMRAIPNFTVVSAADAVAAEKFVKLVAERPGPVFLRIGRGNTPIIYDQSATFEIGKAIEIRNYGDQATIISTGRCVVEAVEAAAMLNEAGYKVKVVDMHTLKPLDRATIVKAAKETGIIVTVEDCSLEGGLGSAVAEVLAEEGLAVKFRRMGLDNTFGSSGKLDELLDMYKISAPYVQRAVRDLIESN
jgi:transketolase